MKKENYVSNKVEKDDSFFTWLIFTAMFFAVSSITFILIS